MPRDARREDRVAYARAHAEKLWKEVAAVEAAIDEAWSALQQEYMTIQTIEGKEWQVAIGPPKVPDDVTGAAEAIYVDDSALIDSYLEILGLANKYSAEARYSCLPTSQQRLAISTKVRGDMLAFFMEAMVVLKKHSK